MPHPAPDRRFDPATDPARRRLQIVRFGTWTPLQTIIKPEPWCEDPGAAAGAERRSGSLSGAERAASGSSSGSRPNPEGIGRDPWYAEAVAVARLADRLGFSLTLVAQRLLGPDLEAFMLSSALAAQTRDLGILTAVHPGFWTPQVAAKMGASLDRMSGGRFAVNLVTGWWEEEHRSFGAALLEGEDRYRRAEEFVTVMRRLWAEEEVTFHGAFYDLDGARLPTRPVGGPPPLYAAARSDQGRDLMARVADWWFLPYSNDFRTADANLEAMAAAARDMAERAARAGRRVRFAVHAFVVLDEDEARARGAAEDLERYGRSGRIAGIHINGLGVGLIGGARRIADRLAELEAIGVEFALLKFTPLRAGIEAFAERVLPLVGRTAGAAR